MSSVITQLEAARKELLDLGLRNSLLNYRPSKARGVTVIQERAADIFDILVKNGRFMTFAASSDSAVEIDEIGQPSESHFADSKLQTNHSSAELQKRLLKTHHVAQTYIEENGVNILYLALGMLNWFDKDSPKIKRQAPLILIPALLARQNANDRFHLEYTGTDISTNLSLEAKLRIDDALQLPSIVDGESLDVETYFKAVETAVSTNPSWSVTRTKISLGFFSFNKFFMYSDLDPKRWEGVLDLNDHPVLRPLLDDHGFFEGLDTYEARSIDEQIEYAKSHQVVDADSSQTRAILDVNAGRNLVIQGPPGTGKSQTITNIIAEAVGNGKTVLFVSEKMAALDVVKRRLDVIGLGDAALELHSHKTTKATLMAELYRTFQLGQPKETAVFEDFDKLTQTRNHLNAYAIAMNEPVGQSDLTPYQLFGTYLTLKAELEADGLPLPTATFTGVADWSKETIAEKRILIKQLAELLPKIGQPIQHPFWGSEATEWNAQQIEQVKLAALDVLQKLQTLQKSAVAISIRLGLSSPQNRSDTEQLVDTIQHLLDAPNLYAIDLFHEAWGQEGPRIRKALDIGAELAFLRAEYDAWLIPSAWEADVSDIRQPLMVHGKRGFLRNLSGRYREARNKLLGLCRNDLPDEPGEQVALVDAILAWQAQQPLLEQMEPLFSTLFGIRWMGVNNSDWSELNKVGHWLVDLNSTVSDAGPSSEKIGLPQHLLAFLKDEFTKDAHDQLIVGQANLRNVFDSYSQSVANLQSLDTLVVRPEFEQQVKQCTVWAESVERLPEMAAFNLLVKQCQAAGLGGAVDVLNEHYFSILRHRQRFLNWFDWQVADKLRQRAQVERESLGGFEGQAQDTAVAHFQTLDQQFLQYNRLRLATEHWETLPKHTAHGLMGLLMREASKKRNHQPVRTIIKKTAPIIQRIKPIIMMSPLSIAMYLEPGDMQFDLVVFDEASQVRPVDAFGAILRGKQTVVVGDSRQLPPTTFFDRVLGSDGPADEDSEAGFEGEGEAVQTASKNTITAHNESILDLFVNKGAPERLLRWHYRSRHESLIALSNREFYDNQLLLFPSPDAGKQDSGLHLKYLPHSVYDRGKSRINQIEAEAVAEAVMAHVKTTPNLTLGVVAFSTAQRDAIESALEKLRRQPGADELFFQKHPTEPFFIKNLENVQGDERDVIFISMGYGKTTEGKVNLNFGPLNPEGGERRLNVLITRSRRQCVLFTNLKSTDIDLKRTESRGVKSLKAYLAFAETGEMEQFAPLRYSRPAPFEEMLVQLLQENGHTVSQKVGHNGITIDIAVVDSQNSENFLVGVECDGETYDGSLSARDRDRVQPAVLEGLGWRILRVWSTEWLADYEGAKERFLTAVSNPQPANQPTNQKTNQFIPRYAPQPLKPKAAQPYKRSTLQHDLTSRENWRASERKTILISKNSYYWDPENQQYAVERPVNALARGSRKQVYSGVPTGNKRILVWGQLKYDFSNGEFYSHGPLMVEWDNQRRRFYYNPHNHYFYARPPKKGKDKVMVYAGAAVWLGDWKKSQSMPAEGVEIPRHADELPVKVDDAIRRSVQIEYQLVEQILREEGPLHRDELDRAFARVVGASQLSASIKQVVQTAASVAFKRKLITQKGDFIFLHPENHETIVSLRSRDQVPSVSKRFDYVPDLEIELAIQDVVVDSYTIDAFDVPDPVFALLGFGNLGVAAKQRVIRVLKEMLENGRLGLHDNWVAMPEVSSEKPDADYLEKLNEFVTRKRKRPQKRKTPLDTLLGKTAFALTPYEIAKFKPLYKLGNWTKASPSYSHTDLLFLCRNCLQYDPILDKFGKILTKTEDAFRGRKFLDFGEKLPWNSEDLIYMGNVQYDFVLGQFVHNGRLLIHLDNFLGPDKYYRLWREGASGDLYVRRYKRYEENKKNNNYMTHANGKFHPGTQLVKELPTRTCKAQVSPIKVLDRYVTSAKRVESALMKEILETESPIHLTSLEQRIVYAFYGKEKAVSPKIKQATRRLAQEAVDNGIAEIRGEFVWLAGMERPLPRSRQLLEKRWHKLEFVALEELSELILKIRTTYPQIKNEHIPDLVAYALFGQKRFGKAQEAIVQQAIEKIEVSLLEN